MRVYQLDKLGGLDGLKLAEADVPGPGQVVVRMRACSISTTRAQRTTISRARNALAKW